MCNVFQVQGGCAVIGFREVKWERVIAGQFVWAKDGKNVRGPVMVHDVACRQTRERDGKIHDASREKLLLPL